MQNAGEDPSLTPGGNMGYHGMSNSLAVEFDAHENEEIMGDPNDRHISVQPGGNAHHGASIAFKTVANLRSGTKIARIVYDEREESLKVYLNFTLQIDLSNFSLSNYVSLDDGAAYIGLVATTGNPFAGNGPTTVSAWSASFPQSCEKVFWEKVSHHTSDLGYNGDHMDHMITGEYLDEEDVIAESLEYLWDDIGLTDEELGPLLGHTPGQWKIVSDSRHGLAGLWRGSVSGESDTELDEHSVDTRNRPSFTALYETGSGIGTLALMQVMTDVRTGFVVARHRLIYRFVKMAPETTEDTVAPIGEPDCVFTDGLGFHFHQVVQKQNARNESVWTTANSASPMMPCP